MILTLFNPFTKMKWFDIEYQDHVFSIFNYFTSNYTCEIRIMKGRFNGRPQ